MCMLSDLMCTQKLFSSTFAATKGPPHPSAPVVCCCGNTVANYHHRSSLFIAPYSSSLSKTIQVTAHGFYDIHVCQVINRRMKKMQISRNRTLCASETNVLWILVTINILCCTSFDADTLMNISNTFTSSATQSDPPKFIKELIDPAQTIHGPSQGLELHYDQ